MQTWRDGPARHERRVNRAAGVLTVLLAAYSLAYVANHPNTQTSGFITGAWIIGAPAVFWYEWYYLIDHKDPEKSRLGKEGIDIRRNIWAGLAVLLALLYTR